MQNKLPSPVRLARLAARLYIQTPSTTYTNAIARTLPFNPFKYYTLNHGDNQAERHEHAIPQEENTETKSGEYYHGMPRVGNKQSQTLQMPGSPLRPRNAN